MRIHLRNCSTLILILLVALPVLAQSADNSSLPDAPVPQSQVAPPVPPGDSTVGLRTLPGHLLADQKTIWTSPFHLRATDAEYLIPFAVGTGLLIGSDRHSMNELVKTNTSDQQRSRSISDATVLSLVGLPALMYGWSQFHYAPRAHEAALLSGEAAANAYAVSEVLKLVTRRERPALDGARGSFGSSATLDGSFPSNHAILAWSIASVLGSAYPGWLSRLSVYSVATGVSVSRITAKEHFPADVFVGSATGWLIGHYVYRAHHNADLDFPMPGDMGPPPHQPPDPIPSRPPHTAFEREPDRTGSTFVPMDSWIYPALDRLAAFGLIESAAEGTRPWTRMECWRQLQEAEDNLERRELNSFSGDATAATLIRDLRLELEDDPANKQSLEIDSVYARYGNVAGRALSDSYHFGQTWQNDYGRPLVRGASELAGFSVRATRDRLFFYVREEYQGAATPQDLPLNTRLYLASLDTSPVPGGPLPLEPEPSRSPIRRQRPLELYAGIAFGGNALSFGKQELYWGPLVSGPLAFSANAEPTYNLRFVSTRPHPFPGFLSEYGAYRFDLIAGKLSGHAFPQRPWFNGQKLTLNLGRNLELGFTRWSIFAGVGHPMTLGRWRQNLFSFSSTGGGGFGSRDDPGDRKSGFDFRYRLPGLRDRVTLYSDSYADDDPSPLASPRRSVISPGIYVARLPGLPRVDLRVESTSSLLFSGDKGGQFSFWNNQYLDDNVNKGFLLGNATGRDARSIEARSTYWISGRTSIQGGYRQTKGGANFLAGGATITDGFSNTSVALGRDWTASLFAQYERFLIPSINGLPANAGPHHNVSGWLQITYRPGWKLTKPN